MVLTIILTRKKVEKLCIGFYWRKKFGTWKCVIDHTSDIVGLATQGLYK
jgi:hypothetical protein